MKRTLAICFTAVFGLFALCANGANATTFTLDQSNGCNGGCNTGPFGSVNVTANSGTLHFIVTLFGTFNFLGGVDTFAFNLTGGPTVTFSNFTPNTFSASNTVAGNFAMDGFGKFMYGVTAPGSGGSSPGGQSLIFDVTDAAHDLTLASLTRSDVSGANTGQLFAADICPLAGCGQGLTGFAAGSSILNIGNEGTTPLPAALPLFATGLGGLGLLGWRRKRKTAVVH